MTNGEFREWLKGFFELSGEEVSLNAKQLQIIVNHLNLAEAVEGKLDTLNQQLRVEIQTFRNRPSPDAGDFTDVTQALRQQILQD